MKTNLTTEQSSQTKTAHCHQDLPGRLYCASRFIFIQIFILALGLFSCRAQSSDTVSMNLYKGAPSGLWTPAPDYAQVNVRLILGTGWDPVWYYGSQNSINIAYDGHSWNTGFQIDQGVISPPYFTSPSLVQRDASSAGTQEHIFQSDGVIYYNNTPTYGYTSSAHAEIVMPDAAGSPPSVGTVHTANLILVVNNGTPKNCDCNCKPGQVDAQCNSVDLRIALGKGLMGSSQLTINSELPTPSLATPAALNLESTPEVTVHSATGRMQVLSPQALADIITSNAYCYQIFFYPIASKGTFTNGLYVPDTNGLYKIVTVQNTNGATDYNTLSITDLQIGVQTNAISYVFDTNTTTWSFTSYNGLHVEAVSRSWNGDNTQLTEVKTISEAGGGPVRYKEQSLYQVLPWGKERIQQIIDPDGSKLTNSWAFYTNSTDNGFTKLQQKISYTGDWERYEYDTNARPTNLCSSYLNAPITASTSQCRMVATTYSPYDPTHTTNMMTIVETVLGQEVSRTYKLYTVGVLNEYRCQTPGAALNASDNLLTVTTSFPGYDPDAGEPQIVLHPDGTMQFYSHTISSTQRVDVLYSGQPKTDHSAILEGTKTVTVTGSMGEMVSRIVYNVTNGVDGVTLSSEVSTYDSGDSFKKSPTVTYLDGTTTQTISDCCGVASTTDKDGTSTEYLYDGQKRRIGTTLNNLSITTTNLLDATGNTLRTVRVGSDSSLMTIYQASYDLAKRLVSETNALNGVTSYTNYFDANGQLIKQITYPDLSTRIETNAMDGSLMGISGTAVHPVIYLYGVQSDGGVQRLYTTEIKVAADGGTNEWTTTFKDMLGRAYKTVYSGATTNPCAISYFNSLGQFTNQIDPDGVSTLYAYNLKGEQTYTVLDTNQNHVIDFDSDRITFTTNDVVSDNGVTVRRTRTYVWPNAANTNSQLISTAETSVDGLRSWNILYNGGVGLTNSTQTAYDSAHGYRYVTNTGPDGAYAAQTFQYGRLFSVTQKDTNATQLGQTLYGYDPHGRQTTNTDARNGSTIFGFNNADQITSTVTPSPAQTTTYYFDNMGRNFATQLPDSTWTTNVYTLKGELQQTYGSRTYPVGYGYDAQGRMTSMTNWTSAATGVGARVTTWTFDAYRGFLTSKTYDGGVAGPSYTYTAAGRLLTRLWARGITTTYSYNTLGELSAITYSDGSTPAMAYGYDRRGRQTAITNGATICTLAYNDAGNVLTESYSGGPLDGISITNGYDSFLRRTNLSALNSTTPLLQHSYSYDPASRLFTVSDGTNSAAYSYLANSPLVSQIAFTNSGALRMTTTKTYDYLNRLISISSANASSVVLDSHGYAYNTANQRTSVTNADGTYWIYLYDALGQVTSGKKFWPDGTPVAGEQFGYAFDDIGNRTTTSAGGDQWGANLRYASYSANNLNQYTSRTVPGAVDILGEATNSATVTVNNQPTYRHGTFYRDQLAIGNGSAPAWQSVTNLAVLNQGTNADIIASNIGNIFLPQTPEQFTYDADGNVTSDGRWTNYWDAENRLISMQSLTNSPTGSKLWLTFSYDYQGRRIAKTARSFNGASWNITLSNKFAYDGWNLVGELNGTNNATIRAYMWGSDLSGTMQGAGGVGGLLAVSSPSSAQFTSFDGNGNTTALIDTGTSIDSGLYVYGPFGEVIHRSGPAASPNPFRFSTKYQDDETDLLYYGYRYYKPSIGMWLSRDLMEEQGGVNLYGFVGNDSSDQIDTLGLWRLYDALGGHNTYNKTISLKALLNLPGQDTKVTQIANAVADAIEPATLNARTDSMSFGTTADPTSICACVDLEVTVSGDLDKAKEAITKGLTTVIGKLVPELSTKKFAGDAKATANIHIHDCKNFSKSEVEFNGQVDIDVWAGWNYDLKTIATIAGFKSGVGLTATFKQPSLLEVGETAEIDLNGELRLKAGSEVTVIGQPPKKVVNLGDTTWAASLQIYPELKFIVR